MAKPGIGSWSGPDGEDAAAVKVGPVVNIGRGCWRVDDHDHPWNRTSICAWDSNKNQGLYLGPMKDEDPVWNLLWGGNTGEWARIISSSGLDTENAVVVAEKSLDGAIEACRDTENDWSTKCIDQMIDRGPAPRKATLRGNCTTKEYTDFPGRHWAGLPYLHYNGDVAETAFEALCPQTARRMAPH